MDKETLDNIFIPFYTKKRTGTGLGMPVLLLTARNRLDDRLKGLNVRADDYITKPFELSELPARLKAVIRRYKGTTSPTIETGDLVIDANSHTVTRAGMDIPFPCLYNMIPFLPYAGCARSGLI